MGKLAAKLGWAGLLAGAAVLLYARSRAQQTGRDMGTVLSNLPNELKATRAELEREVKVAVEAGKKAAAEREEEFDRELSREDTQISPMPDFLA